MGPYGGLSLQGGQQAALPLIGTWNLSLTEKAVGLPNQSAATVQTNQTYKNGIKIEFQ